MNITNFDERNIRYFARSYCCNQASFEDLVQEGWVAALSAEKPEHKYLAVKRAIQTYTRRARFIQPVRYLQPQREESPELQMIEDLDHLESILKKANLTEKESQVIQLIYFESENNLDKRYGSGHRLSVNDRQLHSKAMKKLRAIAKKEEEIDAR